MPEIGTSGSMSEDGKRSVAKWPKLPRLSSTLPPRRFAALPKFERPVGELRKVAASHTPWELCPPSLNVKTTRVCDGIVAFTPPRAGGAYDSPHGTGGIAGRSWRRDARVAILVAGRVGRFWSSRESILPAAL